jgi:ABC-type branched-subunit amino acid transport system ATPase component
MSNPVLMTQGLCKNFGALRVTSNLDLRIDAGARHALIGPNGAGKSTLVNLLTGVLAPTSGKVFLNSEDITRLPAAERVWKGLSRTFQVSTIFPRLTPFEATVLAICRRERLLRNPSRLLSACKAEAEEAWELLDRFKLSGIANRSMGELAYGQQRLTEIILALAARPRVLLLDEPAAGVPAQDSEALFSAIENLPRDVAVLFIEHDMELVFRFAEKITVLVAGELFREGAPAEIAADPDVRRVYLGDDDDE